MEYWKVLNGFKSKYGPYYWVSSLGRFKNGYGRILKFHKHKKGYLMVQLPKEGYARGARWQAHRLVAKTFIPNPDQLPQVNHLDEVKTNNAVSNLQWCTDLQNKQHSASLTPTQVKEIREFVLTKGPTTGLTRKELARRYGVSESLIKDVRSNRSYV